MTQTPLTVEQMDALVVALPDGHAGMFKAWGYRDLIQAVEAHHKITTPKLEDIAAEDDLRCNVFAVGDRVRVIGNMVGPFVDVNAFKTGRVYTVSDVKNGWLYTVNGMTYIHEALERAE